MKNPYTVPSMKLSALPSDRMPSCVTKAGSLLSPVVLLLGLAMGCSAAGADVLDGRVVGVTDGDTLTVIDAAKTEYKIRVAGIDAPEKAMPWGQKSKQALSDRVYGRDARVDWSKRDRYGRIVGKVIVDGKDAGLALVGEGLAWHYKKYENEQPLADRLEYARLENEARSMRRGLWSDPAPVPPWEWRKQKQ
ncbi:thermonuclease family protein [Thiobacillus sp.]|uniref:thermonuclease family protein n=1 Tax=Thiobacillus sp. TaxID=924 RepID=UPI003435DECA